MPAGSGTTKENITNSVSRQSSTVKQPILRTRTYLTSEYKKSRSTSPFKGKYPEYRDYVERVASYEGWPERIVRQKPQYLAKCGFFYIGSADRVRCFCCGTTLRNWEAGDDPYIEHITWAPECLYISSLKRPSRGAASADEVRGCLAETLEGRQSPASGSHGERESLLGSSLPATRTPAPDRSSGDCGPGEPDRCPSSQSDSSELDVTVGRVTSAMMNSPKVLAVVDMGFSRELVQSVVQMKLVATGEQYATATELYKAVERFVQPR